MLKFNLLVYLSPESREDERLGQRERTKETIARVDGRTNGGAAELVKSLNGKRVSR